MREKVTCRATPFSDNWARKVGPGTALCMPEPWMDVLITVMSSTTYVRSRIEQGILEIELGGRMGRTRQGGSASNQRSTR